MERNHPESAAVGTTRPAESRAAFLQGELQSINAEIADAEQIISRGKPATSDVAGTAAYVQAVEALETARRSRDVLKRALARTGGQR